MTELIDLMITQQPTKSVALPINIIRLPGDPTTNELTDAGVARIGYGTVSQLMMGEWLKQQATTALTSEI